MLAYFEYAINIIPLLLSMQVILMLLKFGNPFKRTKEWLPCCVYPYIHSVKKQYPRKIQQQVGFTPN
jgi:hypothetical protein